MLKFKITTLDEVAEPLRAFYKAATSTDKDGNESTVYILQVDGAVGDDKLKEVQKNVGKFRQTNIKAARLLETVARTLGVEITDELLPDELAEVIKEKLEADAGVGKGGKAAVEAEVAKRVEAYKKDMESKLAKAGDSTAKMAARLEKVEIENAVVAEAAKRGLVEGAARDVVMRAREVFKYRDGKVVALEEDGETPRSGKDATDLTISEWVDDLAKSKEGAHLFKSNSGGGASGGSGGAGRNGSQGPNPWKPGAVDMKRQMQLIKSDLPLARRLAAEHGVTLPETLVGR